MLAIGPALFLAASLASSTPAPSLLQEALSATEAPARFRLQPPPGALVGIADANGDGKADVVVAASRTRGAWLLPGDGKGNLGTVARLEDSIGAQGVGDVDADGAVEQLSGGAFGTETVLLQGKAGQPLPALTADLDGDGAADLAQLEGAVLRIAFAEEGRQTTLGVGADAVSLAAADLDRDGALDLVVADAHNDQVSVFLSDGQGRFRAAGGYQVFLRPFSLAAGDLDDDGAVDLVVADQCGSTVAALRGTGNGGFGSPTLVTQESGPAKASAGEAARVSKVKSLTVSPATLSRETASPAQVTVRLEAPAPAEGLTLRLRSSDPALVAPEAEVIVPAGETTVVFPVVPLAQARRGRLSYLATLTASTEGGTASATLTVTP